MKLIVGLGNPGKEYEGTRHNIGFRVAEKLANAGTWNSEKNLFSKIQKVNDALYIEPQTYMNNSGQAVAAVCNYYKIDPKDVWVIHDDLDLPVGRAQIRFGGGTSGGHHGLESVIEHLRTTEFGRIRIGIRGDELRSYHAETGIDTNDFVMGRFTATENEILLRVFDEVTSRLDLSSPKTVNIVV